MDKEKLKQTIDEFVEGDPVFIHIQRAEKNKHVFLRYKGHDDYQELISDREGRGPVYGDFWLDIPGIMGINTPIPIRGDGHVQIDPSQVRFITNNLEEAADYLRDIGQEVYAHYIDLMLVE